MNFKPDSIVLHTAAFRPNADIAEIRRWHLERGFSDVGYHFHILRDGTIQEGRPLTVMGAHCKAGGMNRRSIGICFEGHGDFEEWTLAQADAFYLHLYRRLRIQFGIMPESVFGHREFEANKTCPGKLIDMDAVRDRLIVRYSSTTSHAAEK